MRSLPVIIRPCLTCLILSFATFAFSQSNRGVEIKFEFQAYPTGLIPGIRLEKSINEKSAISLRIGYNWIRHRDLGEHEDERGNGYGFSVGYKRYFERDHRGWHAGIRSDIWWNGIDWDEQTVGGRDIGHTNITVLQPTVEVGKSFVTANQVVIGPSIAFGYEWNVMTKGEPTGQGAILLLGLQIGKRF